MLVAVFSEFGSWWGIGNIGNNQRAQMPNLNKSLLKSAVDHTLPDETIAYYRGAFRVILNMLYVFLFHRIIE